MKKNIINKLKALAAEMPPKLEAAITIVEGSQLISNGTKVDGNGLEINPKRRYKIGGSKLVNHEQKLKESFKRGGTLAVTVYCNTVMPRPIIAEQIQENLRAEKKKLNGELTDSI